MGRRFLLLVLSFMSGLLLFTGVAYGQQDEEPRIEIEWPNEGETLYAGPTSLLYSVPIKGRVSGVADGDFPLTVELEMVQDGRVVESERRMLNDNGHVEFFVTVNPEGSDGQFPAEQSGCATSCHFASEMSLPAGPMELRLAIVEPLHLADVVGERHVVVDRSGYATIPVTVTLRGEGDTVPDGVNVSGATQIYLWRARHALAATDNRGQAQLKVEALSQAPTEYVVRVQPTIVDGVLYEGTGEERVTLAPGASRGEAIELAVSGRQGQLSGQLSAASQAPPQIWAVCLPDGHTFQTPVDAGGDFQFVDLPLQAYRLTLDPRALADMGLGAQSIDVDLAESAEQQVTVPVREERALAIGGAVEDKQNDPLPFAWVAAGEGNRFAPVLPDSGRFLLSGQAAESRTLYVRAPGYYSRAYALGADAEGRGQTIALAPQPETRFLPWGQGAITVPAGSDVEAEGPVLRVQRGWVWGEGQESEPLVVEAGDVRLTISAGRFALERLPQRGWFYLLEGAARAEHVPSGREVELQAPVMLNLSLTPELVVAPYEPVALHALQDVGEAPLADAWQPTLSARLGDGLARLGVGAAQVVTFLTYAVILLSLIVIPLGYVFHRRGRS